MTRLISTRFGVSYPDPATRNEPADVPNDLQELVLTGIENAAMYDQGTFATRPAAGIEGRHYFVTDRKELHYDTGTAWINLSSREIDYVESTTPITVTEAATQASPLTLLDFGANNFTGQKVLLEFYCPRLTLAVPDAFGNFSCSTFVNLWDSTTNVCILSAHQISYSSSSVQIPSLGLLPLPIIKEFTPTEATHTYKLRAYIVKSGAFTAIDAVFDGGLGNGANASTPMFARMSYV